MTTRQDIQQLQQYEKGLLEMYQLIEQEYARLTIDNITPRDGGQLFDHKYITGIDAREKLDKLIVNIDKELILTRYTFDIMKRCIGKQKPQIKSRVKACKTMNYKLIPST